MADPSAVRAHLNARIAARDTATERLLAFLLVSGLLGLAAAAWLVSYVYCAVVPLSHQVIP